MTIDLITDSARKVFERDLDLGFMRTYRTAPDPDKARLVRLCHDMGWHGLLVGEEYGGFGYDLEAACALLQELGQAAFPTLCFSHFAVPALVLNALDESRSRNRALEAIANGDWVPVMATNTATVESFSGAGAYRMTGAGTGSSIDGAAELVCDADSANVLLVPAEREDGLISIVAIEKAQLGVQITARTDHVYGATFSVACAGVVPGEHAHLGVLTPSVLRDVYCLCAIGQSSMLIGHAQRAMAFALAHIVVRKQFGKLLAEFQAVQHQAADMYRGVDVAQLFLREALDQRGGESLREHASCCKAWTNDAASQASATSHQLMGGTGYMIETNLHLLTSLVLRGQYEFGSADYHRELIADLMCERPA